MWWIPSVVSVAMAQDLTVEQTIPSPVPSGGFTTVDIVVPEGVAELEIAHRSTSTSSITDWGLLDPTGALRGWGGGNAENIVIGTENASRSYLPGPISAGTWKVLVGLPGSQDVPYNVILDVWFRDLPSLAPDPDRGDFVPPAPLESTARWYAGDFHVHSRQSGDAWPTLDEVADAAVAQGLDFVLLSEHNTVSHLTLLSAVQARHPDVLLLPGIEWTTHQGHALAIGATDTIPFWVGVDGLTAEDAIIAAHDQDALFAPAHPGLQLGDVCLGCGWEHTVAPTLLDGVEVQTLSVDTVGTLLFDAGVLLWDATCAAGVHAAALGGSDDHNGGTEDGVLSSPLGHPTTLVEAENLSVDAILTGIRNGRTVVKLGGPDDPMVILDSDGRMGDTVFATSATLSVTVAGGEGGTLSVWTNGENDQSWFVDADPWTQTWTVSAPPTGETRVRALLSRDGLPRTITSHLWVRLPDADTGFDEADGKEGCGCATASTAGTWLLPLFCVGLVRRRHGVRPSPRQTAPPALFHAE